MTPTWLRGWAVLQGILWSRQEPAVSSTGLPWSLLSEAPAIPLLPTPHQGHPIEHQMIFKIFVTGKLRECNNAYQCTTVPLAEWQRMFSSWEEGICFPCWVLTLVDKAAGTGGQGYSSAKCQTCIKDVKALLYAAGTEALWPQRSLHCRDSICRIKCGLDRFLDNRSLSGY